MDYKDTAEYQNIQLRAAQKTYEIDKVTTAGNFLTEVTSGAANVFDVKVSLTENDITVTIHANTIKKNKLFV